MTALPSPTAILFQPSRYSASNSNSRGRVNNGFKVFASEPLRKNNSNEFKPLAPMKIITRYPYWSMVLSNITTLSVAAEKMWENFNMNIRQFDMVYDTIMPGKLVNGGDIYQQNYLIRSYEIGANGVATPEVMLNYFQDCALDHLRDVGLSVDGFGSSPEMNRRNMILIVCKTQISVDRYPSYGDMIQVSTWLSPCGKNGYRRFFDVRDCKTGKRLIRLNSLLVMMNKETRKLSRCIQEIKMEFKPHIRNCDSIMEIDKEKLPDLDDSTADHIVKGLTPELNDLDINQHVNNSKFVGLILESTPRSILNTHELYAFTLEYKKECKRDSVMQSLTAISRDDQNYSSTDMEEVKFNHLVRLENGDAIVKGKTSWRIKTSNYQCGSN